MRHTKSWSDNYGYPNYYSQRKLACDKRTSCDVSVIVPCYNTQRYLKQALSSLLNNNVCDLEILLINDGSTDASLDIMKEFAAKDARIRIIDKQNQ